MNTQLTAKEIEVLKDVAAMQVEDNFLKIGVVHFVSQLIQQAQ